MSLLSNIWHTVYLVSETEAEIVWFLPSRSSLPVSWVPREYGDKNKGTVGITRYRKRILTKDIKKAT